MSKVIRLADVVETIPDGATLMIGGFLAVGAPLRLIGELVRQGRKDLTIIVNDTNRAGLGVGRLIAARAVRKVVASHVGTNADTQRQLLAGEIEVELVPQGTLAERIRAGGVGLGGILTPTGVGTLVEDGKPVIEVGGRRFLLETPLRADFALIAAKHADHKGNLDYALTARNFNPLMAMAADTVIAEAQDIVPVGCIPPDQIVTPGVLVDHLVAKEQSHG
ncbi:3-oxoacid CoA-transferase subunit A [Siculibacillus lacustris]|uniref:3-oxoacid CoA-transferase subunit A n=1 Tax=Siculibacillus lacustris TaxID=1549641 RepID=A0A4Q9VL59_9HYPH|nr:3-oxoacid CoA-transferase subunit A [Siculibacillus lacustris]TBW36103.1 3-oxoacid CoA-transferase subunit A [Siculibacillus lacustris]